RATATAPSSALLQLAEEFDVEVVDRHGRAAHAQTVLDHERGARGRVVEGDAARLELGERLGVGATGGEQGDLVLALGGGAGGAQLADGAAADLAVAGAEGDERAHGGDAGGTGAAPVGDAFAATEQLEAGDAELVGERATERVEGGRRHAAEATADGGAGGVA